MKCFEFIGEDRISLCSSACHFQMVSFSPIVDTRFCCLIFAEIFHFFEYFEIKVKLIGGFLLISSMICRDNVRLENYGTK